MPIEKSAGAVIFRRQGDEIKYLLLHYPSGSRSGRNYWDFPKGHIEPQERTEETARREIKEETGLQDIEIIPGFRETIKYFFRWKEKNILKFVTFYLVETVTEKIKISSEHMGYKWLPYEEAIEQLSFKNAKEILKKANDFLSRKRVQSC